MAAPVRKNRAILLRFPASLTTLLNIICSAVRSPLPHSDLPDSGPLFDTLPAQLISGMNRQLLEEDPLCQTTSHPEGMQHVDFTVMRQPLDELRFLRPTR